MGQKAGAISSGHPETTKAGAVVIRASEADRYSGNALVADDPYLAYARIATLFAPKPAVEPGIHPSVEHRPAGRSGSLHLTKLDKPQQTGTTALPIGKRVPVEGNLLPFAVSKTGTLAVL